MSGISVNRSLLLAAIAAISTPLPVARPPDLRPDFEPSRRDRRYMIPLAKPCTSSPGNQLMHHVRTPDGKHHWFTNAGQVEADRIFESRGGTYERLNENGQVVERVRSSR